MSEVARILTGCIIYSCLVLILFNVFRCAHVHVCVRMGGGSLHFYLFFFFKVILFVMLALPIQKKKWNRTRVYKILSWTDNHYRTTLAYFRGTTIF